MRNVTQHGPLAGLRGFSLPATLPNIDPQKACILPVHMSVVMLILALGAGLVVQNEHVGASAGFSDDRSCIGLACLLSDGREHTYF